MSSYDSLQDECLINNINLCTYLLLSYKFLFYLEGKERQEKKTNKLHIGDIQYIKSLKIIYVYYKIYKELDRERDRDRQRDRERQKERDRETERDREPERDIEAERDRETERVDRERV